MQALTDSLAVIILILLATITIACVGGFANMMDALAFWLHHQAVETRKRHTKRTDELDKKWWGSETAFTYKGGYQIGNEPPVHKWTQNDPLS